MVVRQDREFLRWFLEAMLINAFVALKRMDAKYATDTTRIEYETEWKVTTKYVAAFVRSTPETVQNKLREIAGAHTDMTTRTDTFIRWARMAPPEHRCNGQTHE